MTSTISITERRPRGDGVYFYKRICLMFRVWLCLRSFIVHKDHYLVYVVTVYKLKGVGM